MAAFSPTRGTGLPKGYYIRVSRVIIRVIRVIIVPATVAVRA